MIGDFCDSSQVFLTGPSAALLKLLGVELEMAVERFYQQRNLSTAFRYGGL